MEGLGKVHLSQTPTHVLLVQAAAKRQPVHHQVGAAAALLEHAHVVNLGGTRRLQA